MLCISICLDHESRSVYIYIYRSEFSIYIKLITHTQTHTHTHTHTHTQWLTYRAGHDCSMNTYQQQHQRWQESDAKHHRGASNE